MRTDNVHLNSPVTDPGYWPYEKLAGGLQETVTAIDDVPDPGSYVPEYRPSKKQSEDK